MGYVPFSGYNGVSLQQFLMMIFNLKIEYWKSVVMCCVIGENPPLFVIQGWGYDLDN